MKSLFNRASSEQAGGREWKNRAVTLVIGLAAALMVFLVSGTKPVRLFEEKLLDYRFQTRPAQKVDERLILTAVTDRDIEILGRWPWPRENHADLIHVLSAYGASVIGFDILFGYVDELDPASDERFIEAMLLNGNVILPMALAGKGSANDILPFYQFAEAAAGYGFVNYSPDEDGIVRRVAVSRKGKFSFAFEIYRQYMLKSGIKDFDELLMSAPLVGDGELIVNYPTTSSGWKWVSFAQVLQSHFQLESGEKPVFDLSGLKGKIVLVGSTWTGMPDILETPFGESVFGMELHASILNSLLTGKFITIPSVGASAALFFALMLLQAGLQARFRPMIGAIIVLLFMAGFVWFSFYLFWKWGAAIKTADVLIGLAAVYAASSVYHYSVAAKNERLLKNAFKQYVSPKVVAEIIRNPDKLKLGGEVKDVTLLFSDIRGFTSLCEKITPEAVGSLLNEFFSTMTDQVLAYDGMLDKYIGDAMMAIFGAPIEQPDHAEKACRAALAMAAELKSFNSDLEKKGKSRISIGIGLNSGPVKAGNYGSRKRFDYTAIGENVNLASRLEGLTKYYGVDTIISRSTRDLVPNGFICRPLDRVRVKGTTKPIDIFELVGLESEMPAAAAKSTEFLSILEKYYNREWESARKMIEEFLVDYPDDTPARHILERTKRYEINPPPEDWGGVFNHTEK